MPTTTKYQRSISITIRLPLQLLETIEKTAHQQGTNRNKLIKQTLEQEYQNNQKTKTINT